MKKGDSATAMATNMAARATSLVFITPPNNKKADSMGKRLRELSLLNAPYAGITQVRFNGYDLRRKPPPRSHLLKNYIRRDRLSSGREKTSVSGVKYRQDSLSFYFN
jgi:hypothetical protein